MIVVVPAGSLNFVSDAPQIEASIQCLSAFVIYELELLNRFIQTEDIRGPPR